MSLPLLGLPRQIESQFTPDAEVVLFCGDVNDLLADVPDDSVSLVITSPPYNLGKDYESRVSIERYLDTQAQVIAQLCRVLQEDGSLCC